MSPASEDLRRVLERIDAGDMYAVALSDLRLLADAARGAVTEHRVVWRWPSGAEDPRIFATLEAVKANVLHFAPILAKNGVLGHIESRTVSEWKPVEEEVANG